LGKKKTYKAFVILEKKNSNNEWQLYSNGLYFTFGFTPL